MDCLRVMHNVLPSTAHALLSMFAAIYGYISTQSIHKWKCEFLPTGAITMGVVAIGFVSLSALVA